MVVFRPDKFKCIVSPIRVYDDSEMAKVIAQRN